MNSDSEYAFVLDRARDLLTQALATGLVPDNLVDCITTFLVTGTMVKKVIATPLCRIGSVQRETEILIRVMKWSLWRAEPPNMFDMHQLTTAIRDLNSALAAHYAQSPALSSGSSP